MIGGGILINVAVWEVVKKTFFEIVDFNELRWYNNFCRCWSEWKLIVLWKLNKAEKTSTLIQVTICNKTSCLIATNFMSYSNTLLESLILAQDERWRRA
jgi:hypothetical protein